VLVKPQCPIYPASLLLAGQQCQDPTPEPCDIGSAFPTCCPKDACIPFSVNQAAAGCCPVAGATGEPGRSSPSCSGLSPLISDHDPVAQLIDQPGGCRCTAHMHHATNPSKVINKSSSLCAPVPVVTYSKACMLCVGCLPRSASQLRPVLCLACTCCCHCCCFTRFFAPAPAPAAADPAACSVPCLAWH
jgi:hypothetical protein